MWIKVCGLTTPEDALMAVQAGVDALGLNLVPSSPRSLNVQQVREIVDAVRGRVETVAVLADRTEAECRRILQETGVDSLQLHGHESPRFVAALSPHAFKAIGISCVADVQVARGFGPGRLLVDAKVDGVSGGAGIAFDWNWVIELAAQRPIVLAGGLRPENVAEAVQRVVPFGVDVASGVEVAGNKRKKDAARVREFVRSAREAGARVGQS